MRRAQVIRAAAGHLDGRQLICRPFPKVDDLPENGRVVPRLLFDKWVVDAARAQGAEVREGIIVGRYRLMADHIAVDCNGPSGPLTFRAGVLVGADGSNSCVARQLRGYAPRREDRIFAIRAYYEGVRGPRDRADLHFSSDTFPGYYWLFPTGRTTANVGIGMLSDTLPPCETHLRETLLRRIGEDSAIALRLAGATVKGKYMGWPLSTYNPDLPMSGERVLLAGDAAGLINPLNGEGIQYALLSGRWVAQALAACSDGNRNADYSAADLARYDRIVHTELRFDMALAGTVVHLIRNRKLNPLWLSMLQVICERAQTDESYAGVMGGVLAGMLPANRVLDPAVLAKTVTQAFVAASRGLPSHDAVGMHPDQRPSRHGSVTQAGVRMADGMVREFVSRPADTLRWSLSLAGKAADLAALLVQEWRKARAVETEQVQAGNHPFNSASRRR